MAKIPMKFWSGLSRELILFIVGIAVTMLLLGGGLLMTLSYRHDREVAIDAQRKLAKQTAATLTNHLQQYHNLLKLVIQSPSQLESIRTLYPEILEIIVLDQQGDIVAQSADNVSNELLLAAVQNDEIPVFVDDDEAYIVLLEQSDGVTVAARVGMHPLWQATAQLAAEETIYLLNNQRVVIGHPDWRLVYDQQHAPEDITDVGGTYENLEGNTVVGATHPVEGTSWLIVTELIADDAFVDASAERGRIWLLFLVIMLAITIGLGWTLGRRLVHPLRELSEGVQHISSGDLDFRLNMTRADEIGELAQAFDEMADQLANRTEQLLVLNQSLEARVATRTKALQEANDRLEAIAEALYHASQRANAASDAKSQFVANMSHELRTPLNSMIIYHDLLLREVYGDLNDKQRNRLAKSRESAKLLLQLISDILDLAKIEVGELFIKQEVVELRPILEAGSEMVAPLIRGDRVEFRMEIPEVLPSVIGDEQRIQQILLNLLSNAAKFTEDGEIVLWVSVVFTPYSDIIPGMPNLPDGNWVIISVKDTGIGIPEDMHETIFEEFKQVDDSNTRKYSGTGLGLAICKKLVEAQNGYISLDSAPGVGSAFTFALPISPQPE